MTTRTITPREFEQLVATARAAVAAAERPTNPSVCVETCGGRCCKSPSRGGFVDGIWMTTPDKERLEALAADAGVTLTFAYIVRTPDSQVPWLMLFADSCGFLEPSGACRIYDVRPFACRAWPTVRFDGCALSQSLGATA